MVAVKAGAGRRRSRTVPDGARSALLMLINYADADVDYTDEAAVALMMQNPSGKDVDELFQATS